MSSVLTFAGESLIASKMAAGAVLDIDRIVLANVPGQDPNTVADRAEGLPDAAQIVHEYAIPTEFKGFVNPNQVVYSMLLTSDIGPFEFNWLGLYSSADDVVVAITHVPTLTKTATAGAELGNNMTRNFLLEFSGAQELTGVTVEAATWQVDFTVRLKGIDERERLSNRDIYGRSLFFGEGFKVVNTDGSISLQPGTAYVEGVRIRLDAPLPLNPGVLPKPVLLDVALLPQGSDVAAVSTPVFTEQADYADANGVAHYVEKIADIDAAGNVTDLRTVLAGGELREAFSLKGHTHPYASEGHGHTTADVADLLPDPHEWKQGQRYATVALSSAAGALDWDMEACPVAGLVLTEDVSTFAVANARPGATYELTVRQDATGERSLAWPAEIIWPGGQALDVTQDPGAEDVVMLSVHDDGSGGIVIRAFPASDIRGVA
jgi:hypothetical protein